MLALHETNTGLPAHTLFTPTQVGVNQRANAILSGRFNVLRIQGNHNLYNLIYFCVWLPYEIFVAFVTKVVFSN